MKIKKMAQIRRRDAMAIILGTAGAFIMSSSVYASNDKFTQRINKITNNKGAKETEIFLDVPEIAENGNQVKVNFEIESPMSQNDYMKSRIVTTIKARACNFSHVSYTFLCFHNLE